MKKIYFIRYRYCSDLEGNYSEVSHIFTTEKASYFTDEYIQQYLGKRHHLEPRMYNYIDILAFNQL